MHGSFSSAGVVADLQSEAGRLGDIDGLGQTVEFGLAAGFTALFQRNGLGQQSILGRNRTLGIQLLTWTVAFGPARPASLQKRS